MTPTNIAMTPEIKNIADNQDVKHTVIPTPHTHLQSEVDGLVLELADKANASDVQTALEGKANIVHTHTQSEIDGLQSALMNKADANRTETELNKKIERVQSATSGDIAVFDIDGGVEDSGTKVSGLQPKLTFDSTPTANSTNPVTSGGVAAALAGKMDTITVDQTPSMSPSHANNLISSYAVGMALGSYVKFNAGGKFTFEGTKLTPVVTDDFIFGGFHVDASSLEYTCPMALHITKTVSGSSVMMFATVGSMYLKMSADLKEFDIFILVGDKFFRNHGFTNADQQGYLHFDHWAESASFLLIGSFFE